MTQRIALETLDGAKEPAGDFTPCAFAAGESAEAPECSAALIWATCRDQFERQAVPGVCDTGRYRMPYRVWGQGPALILSHGLCDTAATFALPLARLSRRFCCVAYDLPTGVGDGARLGNHSHADLVADLVALVDHLRLDSAALWGVSFGSTIVLPALARDPRRFPIGIVQGGFARRPLAWAEVLLAQFARYWPGHLRHLPFFVQAIDQMRQGEFASLEPARWQAYVNLTCDAPLAAVARRALMINAVDLRPLLPAIRQPVMMICGEHDPLVGRTCEEELRAGLPNVARAEIEGCGHIPHFTHPEVLCEVIEQFMEMREKSMNGQHRASHLNH